MTQAASARHSRAATSATGTMRKSCGLMVSTPRSAPPKAGRVARRRKPPTRSAAARKAFWPAIAAMALAGASASAPPRIRRRSPRSPASKSDGREREGDDDEETISGGKRQKPERQQQQQEMRRIDPRVERQGPGEPVREVAVEHGGEARAIEEEREIAGKRRARRLPEHHEIEAGRVAARADQAVVREAQREQRPAINPGQPAHDGGHKERRARLGRDDCFCRAGHDMVIIARRSAGKEGNPWTRSCSSGSRTAS